MNHYEEKDLIQSRQDVKIKGNDETIKVDCYMLPEQKLSAFSIRKFDNIWVLSIGGYLVTYGSYNHIIETIQVIIDSFPCCYHSLTSLIYFLQSDDNKPVLSLIMALRTNDHNTLALNA